MLTRSPVTVGRARETALLERLLADCQTQSGHAVFLSGEAGIGKSRLAGECARHAAALGLPLLRGRSSPSTAASPFRPLAEALSSHLRRTGPPQDAELLPYRASLSQIVPEWRTGDGRGGPECVTDLAEALLRLLAVLGRETGCLLVLEDMHDADAETLAVVEYLVDNLADLPVLLVATLRAEAGAAFELTQAAERRRVATALTLGPLGAPEVREMAAACLGVPADGVPAGVVDRLAEVGGGNPYLVEELLADMVGGGALRQEGCGWRVAGDLAATVPSGVVRAYAARTARLAPATRDLVVLAALLGPRFTVDTLRLVTGRDEGRLFAELRELVQAELVVSDGAVPDGYAFRHSLIGEALAAGLPSAERAAVARRAAGALREAVPGTDDRRHLAARLLEVAGDAAAAGLLYADAGRQALAAGASGAAVRLLEQGHRLAVGADRVAVTESLVHALAEAGRLDRALELLDTLPTTGVAAPSTESRIDLHTRLAWAALMGGRSSEGGGQLAAAQELLGDRYAPAQTAALAVVEGHLALLPGREELLPGTGQRALWAAEFAQDSGLPELACKAWQLLALLARERGFDEADACLARMLAVAEAHGLPHWRFEALIRLGANSFLRKGDARLLEEALTAAQELGSLGRAHRAEALLAMYAVLTGDPARAQDIVDRCLDATSRMRDVGTHQYLLLTAATLAGHRGQARAMEERVLAFERAGGGRSFLVPVMLGLNRAVCALLQEDRPLAEAELAAAAEWERGRPNVFHLAGRYGLRPLLDVLAGRAGRPEHTDVSAMPAADLAWNRQFLVAADAVLLGREGRPEEAARAVADLRRYRKVFPTGAHLALRLVAEAALADDWGDPVAWLRTAEEYFHGLEANAAAGACRALLRRGGATVAQRRSGRDRIPEVLLSSGVTIREYEVFALMVNRPPNREIARRLVISPRTVEKHLASLLRKTGLPDRTALHRLAAELVAEGSDG
ncbi:helix-turn-helix transcriptional regulator [Streptacidiphilus anmyonensis]|uniref:helix-turn-helix transcriptional regulator n=1 Tax=Streptacidiphilus anmyonensis TaxID=405782 RepID=UPI0005A75207|nr:LuxR family transcriptional regulator [Streptacidiphilus anmyonensis]